MNLRVKALIAATALATLSATCVYAGGSDQYGTWNDGAFAGGAGSQINNSQLNTQSNWSNLSGGISNVTGDAVVQGAAGGNLMDITTMNNTMVNSRQIVGANAAIGSNINVDINTIGGGVGIQNQVLCNGLSVSTDPTYSATRNYQKCDGSDPSSLISANVSGVGGDTVIQGSALGNSFEADSNAPHMPVWNKQINNSPVNSTISASIYDVGGSVGLSSSAIGNTGQIIHYNTH